MRTKTLCAGLFGTLLLFLSSNAAANTTVSPSGDLTGASDQANIKAALEAEKNGGEVELSAGTFYLHKSIVVLDFDGTFKGAGKALTTVQTAPGVDFDVSESLDAIPGIPPARGFAASMFLFVYDPSDDEKGFNMSDMRIVVDQPAVDPPLDGFVDDRRAYLLNTMLAVDVENTDSLNALLGEPFETINLDAVVEDLVIEGIQDPIFRGLFDQLPFDVDNSMFVGVLVGGPNSGDVEISNVHVTNTDIAINVSDNGTALLEDCVVQNAVLGIENFVNPTTATNNMILDAKRRGILLVDAPDSRVEQNTISGSEFGFIGILSSFGSDSTIIGNSISGGDGSPVVAYLSPGIEISDNLVTGDWSFGINPYFGSNDCTIANNLLIDMSSLFGTISVEQSDRCVVRGNRFVNVSSPSLGAVWVSGQFNRIEDNDYTESGLPGWNVGPGAIMLAQYNGAIFNRGSIKNYVFETQYPAGTNVCDQVQGIQGNNVQTLISGEVVGVNPGMCSAVLNLEMFNESNPSLLQQMAEMQAQREEAWDRSRRPH